MPVTALIKLSQGVSPAAGIALKGVPSVVVNVTNGDNTGVQSYKIILVDAPPGGAVAPGILVQANGNTPATSFVPDTTPGSYRIQLLVYPLPGYAGTPNQDIRVFAVPEPLLGFVFPPYQELPPKLPVLGSGLPGEKPDEMNFSSQPFGWAGNGVDGLLLHQLRTHAQGGQPNFSYYDIPSAGVSVPAGQEMFVDQVITGPGLLKVYGLVKSPQKGPPPIQFIQPAQLTADVHDYNPTGFSTATHVVLTSDAPRSITGLLDNPIVKGKTIINGGANAIQLEHLDGGSSSGGQLLLPGAGPLVLGPGAVAQAFRDKFAGQWRAAA